MHDMVSLTVCRGDLKGLFTRYSEEAVNSIVLLSNWNGDGEHINLTSLTSKVSTLYQLYISCILNNHCRISKKFSVKKKTRHKILN